MCYSLSCGSLPCFTTYVQAGLVIASPSTKDPNYLFTWTRDSALVFKTIIDQYELFSSLFQIPVDIP